MEAKTKFDPKKLAIADYKLTKEQIDEPEEFDVVHVKGHYVENSFELSFSPKGKLAKADITIDIRTESDGKNELEATALFHLIYIFKVENLDELVSENSSKKVEVDSMLGSSIASIAYSTTRGILLSRLQGKVFQKFILPIINPNDLLVK